MKSLHVHNCSVIDVEDAISTLSYLEVLELTMCRHLTFQALGQGLRSNVSAHLRVLNISGIYSADGLPYANIEEPFFENLTHTALKVMDGSWTRIMYVKVSMKPLSKLKTFNVSGTMLIGDFYCLTS